MKKYPVFMLLVAALSFAFLACDNNSNPLNTVATEQDGASDISLAKRSKTGVVTVVHGVPGLTVDVYVNGSLLLPNFLPKTVTNPLTLPEGQYDVVIVPAGGNPANPAIAGSAFLPAGANVSLVAHLKADGTPTLGVFVNDVSRLRHGATRFIARHTAAAPTVDIKIFRKDFYRPVRAFNNVSNGDEGTTAVVEGKFKTKLFPAGANTAVFESDFFKVKSGKVYIGYAIGSLTGGSFDLILQTIDLR